MNSIIFGSNAEYCDHAGKLTIKVKDNQIRTEIWDSSKNDIDIKTINYSSPRVAYKNYKIKIGEAILGGWKVLNAYPQRETWETKRSK